MDVFATIENPDFRFIVTLLAWLALTYAVYQALRVLVRRWVGRSRTQLDDVIINIISRPLILLLVSYGFLNAWEASFGESSITDTLQRVHQGLVIFLTAYVAWRILYEIVVAKLK